MTASTEALIFRARDVDPLRPPQIDAHLHTSWTDGKATVAEVYAKACSAGLDAILFSEHSRKTSVDWFSRFAMEVRSLPPGSCRAFVGTEVKVESMTGRIDTAKEILDCCDLVMASVHRFPDENGGAVPFDSVAPKDAINREYALSLAVMSNPDVDILGHVFGMSYRRFKATPPRDLIRNVIRCAADSGVAVEINSHYHPNPHELLNLCREFNCLVTFGSNSHELSTVGAIAKLMGPNSD